MAPKKNKNYPTDADLDEMEKQESELKKMKEGFFEGSFTNGWFSTIEDPEYKKQLYRRVLNELKKRNSKHNTQIWNDIFRSML